MSKKKYVDRWREPSIGKDNHCRLTHRQETFATKTERDAHRARRTLAGPVSAESSMLFRELGQIWLEDHCKLEKAEGQYEQDKGILDRYLIPAFGAVPIKDLTRDHLDRVRIALLKGQSRSGKQLAPKTINGILALAKAIARLGTETGNPPLLRTNVFAGVKLVKVGEQPFGFWSDEERDLFIRLCRQTDPNFANLVAVACHTGLRRGELGGLMRYQLDFKKRQIQVSASFNYLAWKRVERTKNNKVEYVPMNDTVFAALMDRQLNAPDTPVFGHLNLENAAVKLDAKAKALGIRSIRFHDLRHTFASSLVAAGVPLFTVQKLMRHKTTAMTQRYAHLAPEHLHDAVSLIEGTKTVREVCAVSDLIAIK